jgi:hypothetical protein
MSIIVDELSAQQAYSRWIQSHAVSARGCNQCGPSSSGLDFSSNETWCRINANPLLLLEHNQVNRVKAATYNAYLVAQIRQHTVAIDC